MMTDLDTSSPSGDAHDVLLPEPIRLPLEPAPATPLPGEVIELNRSTLGYIVFVVILVIGAYTAGWATGKSPVPTQGAASSSSSDVTDTGAQTAPLSVYP
jgi:hypothetical protein